MKIAITSGKSLVGSFLIANAIIIVALSAFIQTGSADKGVPPFENICRRGDIYEVTGYWSCARCSEWCRSECRRMGSSSITQQTCTPYSLGTYTGFECVCCCNDIRPPGTHNAPPSVPLPPTRPNFGKNMCTGDQKYVEIFHNSSSDCALKSLCERKCTSIGGSSVRTECMGNAHNTGDGIANEWYEQCCCDMPPPPPPPSPPPPSSPPPPPSPPPPSPSPPPPSPPPPSPPPPPPSPPPPSPPPPPPSPPPPSPSPPPPSPPPPSPPPPPICPESCCPAEIEVPVPGQEPCRYGILPRARMPSLPHAPGSLSFAAI
ncbi:hypothetical protein MKW92_027606 [Papaver armeniacum]|nr:hypothetical protein MKW92_027606 [Papaver armeniacum]